MNLWSKVIPKPNWNAVLKKKNRRTKHRLYVEDRKKEKVQNELNLLEANYYEPRHVTAEVSVGSLDSDEEFVDSSGQKEDDKVQVMEDSDPQYHLNGDDEHVENIADNPLILQCKAAENVFEELTKAAENNPEPEASYMEYYSSDSDGELVLSSLEK